MNPQELGCSKRSDIHSTELCTTMLCSALLKEPILMTRTTLKNTKISRLVLKYNLVDISYYHLKKLQGQITSHEAI